MNKIHPNAASPKSLSPPPTASDGDAASPKFLSPPPTASDGDAAVDVLTVWRKSLLLNCNGFTVFDSKGNLIFRVDNYTAAARGEIVLMDAAGEPLLTIRRKKLSLVEQWMIYDGEGKSSPSFTVRRHVSPIHCGALAHVTPCGAGERFTVGGSYSRRSCEVLGERRRRVAEIRRKEAVADGVAFGGDVFRLIVESGFDGTIAMAIVIVLEQMFGARGSR